MKYCTHHVCQGKSFSQRASNVYKLERDTEEHWDEKVGLVLPQSIHVIPSSFSRTVRKYRKKKGKLKNGSTSEHVTFPSVTTRMLRNQSPHYIYHLKTQPRFGTLSFCSIFLVVAATTAITKSFTFAFQTTVPFSFPHGTRKLPNTAALFSSTSKRTDSMSGLSPRVLETLDPCVVLMKELIGRYAELWTDKGGIFSLAQGVVYWEPPESCQQALKDELSKPNNLLHTYGPAQGIPELTQALEDKISKENGLNNHDVMVTVGANQAFVNCVLTIASDNSKAVVFSPYYFNHVMALQMTCGDDSVVVGPTNGGVPDLDWLEETLQTTKIDMVTIVNPGNPTGVSLTREFLQQVVDLCDKYSCWLILDCTYEYFTLEESHQPIATFPDAPHVIHIFSFSKSYSLAGYRCGYLCLHKDATTNSNSSSSNVKDESNSLLSNMLKVQDTLPIAPPRISQIAALGALQVGKDWVRIQYDTLAQSRQFILNALQPMEIMGGSGAMYVMARLPPNNDTNLIPDDVEICRQLVEEYGIAIIPGTYCGFPGWIRVCYANLKPELCQDAAERLRMGINDIVFANGTK